MNNNTINIKNEEEIKLMAEGGSKLGKVKKILMANIAVHENAENIENLANKLIKKEGAKSSFKMVKGYSWATCINVNDGVVHGIPKKSVVFAKGDVVSVDVGLYYKGFHTDTSFSVTLEGSPDKISFLSVGQKALKTAIEKAKAGNRIYDISETIQTTIEKAGYSPIKALVGHGIGTKLHEAPHIPCFVENGYKESPKIIEGWVLAIEVMYAQGKSDIYVDDDGWTIKTKDGKIAGLFEETVAVTYRGPKVLTN